MSSGRTSFGQPGAYAAAEESDVAEGPCAFERAYVAGGYGAFEETETPRALEAPGVPATLEGPGESDTFDVPGETDKSDKANIAVAPVAPGATATPDSAVLEERAVANFSYLYRRLTRLYAAGCGSISRAEAASLLESLSFTLDIDGLDESEAVALLAACDPDELFQTRQASLARRMDAALETWREVCAAMPPIRNVALRDTLTSIGGMRALYDTYFAAHEVPCDIQYQLSRPVDERLRGIDYVQAWLDQLLCETRWIAQFTPESCIAALERACPDYRGLHVNLYDLLAPREGELVRKGV